MHRTPLRIQAPAVLVPTYPRAPPEFWGWPYVPTSSGTISPRRPPARRLYVPTSHLRGGKRNFLKRHAQCTQSALLKPLAVSPNQRGRCASSRWPVGARAVSRWLALARAGWRRLAPARAGSRRLALARHARFPFRSLVPTYPPSEAENQRNLYLPTLAELGTSGRYGAKKRNPVRPRVPPFTVGTRREELCLRGGAPHARGNTSSTRTSWAGDFSSSPRRRMAPNTRWCFGCAST